MTEQEVVEKYGDVVLRFSSYYKFCFTFSGVAKDGAVIHATYGGDADEIYRYDVSATHTVESLTLPLEDYWISVQIKKDDETIFLESYM